MQSIPRFTDPINKFPSCVYLKLNLGLLKTSLGQHINKFISSPVTHSRDSKDYRDSMCLRITVRFGKEPIRVAGGTIWFGLKRCELKLRLVNGVIPIEKQGLIAHLENELTLEVQQENGNEIEGSASISSNTGLTAKARGLSKATSKTSYKTYKVSTAGTESDPIWLFEAQAHESILTGQITDSFLGDVIFFSQDYAIEAAFVVRGQQDIFLAEAEGLWDKNIGRNKLAILEREFFLRFLAPKLKPYLSFTEVNHGK
jgi:hypothetical protein